jgi:hypothetical protein
MLINTFLSADSSFKQADFKHFHILETNYVMTFKAC